MAGIPGVEGLTHLACDRVMPLWVAKVYGIPPSLGVLRWSWLLPTAGADRRRRVWWLAYSPADLAFPPHVLRHGLILSVARYFLGASPGEWDALAVREVRQGSARRTIRGRRWAQERRRGGWGLPPRPDAEWWVDRHAPTAVEVDTGKMPLERYLARWEEWTRAYRGLVVVSPSAARAEAWARMRDSLRPRAPRWSWLIFEVDWVGGGLWKEH